MKIMILLLTLLFLFVGLNYRQLYSIWAVWSESKRLVDLAKNAAEEFQNPAPLEDRFEENLSSDFWKFTIINGGGEVSNESAWHSATMAFEDGLTIQHFPDPAFNDENPDPTHKPAAGQYNNVTLISRSVFHPTPSGDVVLKFTSLASEQFYGSAGVVFQPVGTLQENGFFVKPFDMFGFAVIGEESSFLGFNGPLCYLALNWAPVHVVPVNVKVQTWHTYELRLRWISNTEWLGILKVDDTLMCQMPLPAFGPVEIHAWSDNYLLTHRPRHWWEIAPSMELKFQDGGDKQFHLGKIQISAEAR